MLKVLGFFLLFILLAAPCATLFHELGHATLPLLNGKSVVIKVGSGPFIETQTGSLTLQLSPLKSWVGYTSWENHSNEKISLALGPIFSLLLGVSLFFLARRSKGIKSSFLFACTGWCVFQFLFTITPMSYPNWLGYEHEATSDGKKILE